MLDRIRESRNGTRTMCGKTPQRPNARSRGMVAPQVRPTQSRALLLVGSDLKKSPSNDPEPESFKYRLAVFGSRPDPIWSENCVLLDQLRPLIARNSTCPSRERHRRMDEAKARFSCEWSSLSRQARGKVRQNPKAEMEGY